jgi:hypothetical protein
MNNLLKNENDSTTQKNLLLYTSIISVLTVLIYYLIIEPFVIGFVIGEDITMMWNAIISDLSNIYDQANFGFIYPPHFWWQFYPLRFSFNSLLIFMIVIQIISFPVGVYLIQMKFSLKQPRNLIMIIYPAFLMDVIVRNFNTFIFLIVAIMIYYYTKKPFITGLLFTLISFKITSVIVFLLIFLDGDKKIRIRFLLGFILSIVISYLFFPLSNYTLLDYWDIVTAQEGSFNLVLTISRAIRFNHFIWITPVVFSVLYELFLRNQQKKGQVDYKKSFKKSIIISVTAETIFGLIGLYTYILYIIG